MDFNRLSLWCLVPAPALFALRSILQMADVDAWWLGPLLGVGGALSLIGLIILAWRHADARPWVVLVLVGHFGLSQATPDLGAGLVYMGTALLALRWTGQAVAAAWVAFVGALLRPETLGLLLVAVGGAWMAWSLGHAARDMAVQD